MTFEQLLDQSNQAKTEQAFADVELGLTLLDLADTTRIEEDRQLRRKEAGEAYDSVARMVPAIRLTAPQGALLARQMDLPKARLSWDVTGA